MSKERAVLVHSYLMDRKDTSKPDKLTRLGLLAAAELMRRGEVDKVCLATLPELSSPQAKRLEILLDNPEAEISINPQAKYTTEELRAFKELAEIYEWSDLASIACEPHIQRVTRETKKAFGDTFVEIMSSNEILSRFQRYSNVYDEVEKWPEYKSFKTQEEILNTPFLGGAILSLSPIIVPFKIEIQSFVFRLTEKYSKR
jgi:hypothetical protein